MCEVHKIPTPSGFIFDALIEGPVSGELVLLLHGFPQSRHAWSKQVSALAAAGYRAVAPDQRGYSPGARPNPTNISNYALEQLATDILEIASTCCLPGAKFHLSGMDWGGQVAWAVAAAHSDRLASLNIFSRPHPNAFVAAIERDEEQKRRSVHHKSYLDPSTTDAMLANGAERVRSLLTRGHVPPAQIENYLSVLSDPAAMEAAITWYRATGLRISLPPIETPTLYVWGDSDHSVGRMAAEGTAAHVSGEFRFEVLHDIGHFASDQAPHQVSKLLLEHIGRHPA
jgi:pimeloyl-ACP methyl ester carboxylesterase